MEIQVSWMFLWEEIGAKINLKMRLKSNTLMDLTRGMVNVETKIVGWLSNLKESCSNQVIIAWWYGIQFNLANDSQGSNFMLEIVIALKPLLAFLNASKGLIWLTR